MKKPILASMFCLTVISVPAQAELLGAGVGIGTWQATPKGSASFSDQTRFDAYQLNDTSNRYIWAYLNHPLPFLPNAMLEQTDFSSKKANQQLQLDQFDTTFYWGVPLPILDLNFGLTLKNFNGTFSNSLASEKIDDIVPMAYGAMHAPIPGTSLMLSADTKLMVFDGSNVSDTRIKGRWDMIGLGVNLGLEAGYRVQSIKIEGSNRNVETDFKLDGLFAGITLVY